MSENKDINFDYMNSPNTAYNYNAYGPTNSIPDNSSNIPSFYERHWKWALAQATEMMRPIAEKFDEPNVSFSPENEELVIGTQKDIDDICHGILGIDDSRQLFGCTTQDGWKGQLGDSYTKPTSTTYLAEDWALDYISNAAHHELSHQVIVSVRQLLQKDHMERRSKGQFSLDDTTFNSFMSYFSKVDSELDLMDLAKIDKKTKKIVIDKRSNVWPQLEALVDVYCNILKNGLNQ